MTDLYEVLQVPRNASQIKIKQAYYLQAKRWHPDKASSEAERETFEARYQEVQLAYKTLSDIKKKEEYDQVTRSFQEMKEASIIPLSEEDKQVVDKVYNDDGTFNQNAFVQQFLSVEEVSLASQPHLTTPVSLLDVEERIRQRLQEEDVAVNMQVNYVPSNGEELRIRTEIEEVVPGNAGCRDIREAGVLDPTTFVGSLGEGTSMSDIIPKAEHLSDTTLGDEAEEESVEERLARVMSEREKLTY